jgi:hypothetical protein
MALLALATSTQAGAGGEPAAFAVTSTLPAATATASAATATPPSLSNPQVLTSRALGGTPATSGIRHISALAIVIAALGALLVLGCAAWALMRRRAFEPHWWLAMRHSMAEAGYRTSATWAEFTDWLRLGH